MAGVAVSGSKIAVKGTCPVCGQGWRKVTRPSDDPPRTALIPRELPTIHCVKGHGFDVVSFESAKDGIDVTLGRRFE